jgi:hypothetical protein
MASRPFGDGRHSLLNCSTLLIYFAKVLVELAEVSKVPKISKERAAFRAVAHDGAA